LGTGWAMLAGVFFSTLLGIVVKLLFFCVPAVQYLKVFALTRVCERNRHAVGVAEAFAHGWDDSLCEFLLSILSHDSIPSPLCFSWIYHTTIRGPKLPMPRAQRMAGL
jgi:hypothetical protein